MGQDEFIEELLELPGSAVIGELVEQPAQVLTLDVGRGEGNEKVVARLSGKLIFALSHHYQSCNSELCEAKLLVQGDRETLIQTFVNFNFEVLPLISFN